MPTHRRAWLYVRRNTKRTVQLFLLYAVLMTLSLLGLALHAASSQAVRELRESIGGYFMLQTGEDGQERTGDALLEQVKMLDNIIRVNGVDTYYMYAEGLNLVPGANAGSGSVGKYMPKCIGCIDSSLHERFLASAFQLSEGRHITPEDVHTVILSENVAGQSGLSVGDTVTLSVVEGIRDWWENAYGTKVKLEIVGIYTTTRNEAANPMTPESELQENILFTDSSTAKELFLIKFPDRTEDEYTYSSGIMLFLEDPARMEETVSLLKKQPYADWDSLVISENNAAYEQAASPIKKVETVSRLLLVAILAIRILILSLTLLMWNRDRMAEIGILISLGLSARHICRQMVVENYLVAGPAYLASLLLGMGLSGQVGRLVGTTLEHMQVDAVQAALVLLCSAGVILMSVMLASASIMCKRPRDILTDLS